MTALPLTRVAASPETAAAIRDAVRAVAFPPRAPRRLARESDAEGFYALIADPQVSDPIYTLPKPPTLEKARDFIRRHADERRRGEGLLLFDIDGAGRIAGYHDIQVWPQWSAAELGGAIRPDIQGAGAGSRGAATAFAFLFEVIGVELICETAALDNARTAKLLDRLGFRLVGEIESELPGGGVRPSLYFELTRREWLQADSSKIG
jgi:RimJ/RimL family protein N-acetyltransferase